MWRNMSIGWVAFALAACTSGASDSGDSSSEPTEPPPSYAVGQYRVSALVLLSTEEGDDFNGDGEPDNNLPNALRAANSAIGDLDLSPDGFNLQIEQAIEAGDLNLLLDVAVVEGVLTVDVLSGLPWSETDGALVVDPTSFDSQGQPRTRLTGAATELPTFLVQADHAILPVPFVPGDPPSEVPMRDMRLRGTADADLDAVVTGLIPSQQLADDVLADLIPEEGSGSMSREQLLNLLSTFADLPAIADIELSEEERAVSCALSLYAEPAAWEY